MVRLNQLIRENIPTTEEVLEKAYDAVDDYLKRNSVDTICFYNLKDQYSVWGGQAVRIMRENYLVKERGGENSYTDLTNEGHKALEIGIRKYLRNNDKYAELKSQNLELQNENLKLGKENSKKNDELRDLQIEIGKLQKKELKTKILWLIVGAIGAAILQFFVEFLKSKYLN